VCMYKNTFCDLEIYHYYYAISGYHSSEFSIIDVVYILGHQRVSSCLSVSYILCEYLW
jgi:hypothetical protein